MRIPLCAIIFGAASRSTELQLRAFPRSHPMMNVDYHYHTAIVGSTDEKHSYGINFSEDSVSQEAP